MKNSKNSGWSDKDFSNNRTGETRKPKNNYKKKNSKLSFYNNTSTTNFMTSSAFKLISNFKIKREKK